MVTRAGVLGGAHGGLKTTELLGELMAPVRERLAHALRHDGFTPAYEGEPDAAVAARRSAYEACWARVRATADLAVAGFHMEHFRAVARNIADHAASVSFLVAGHSGRRIHATLASGERKEALFTGGTSRELPVTLVFATKHQVDHAAILGLLASFLRATW